ncbi:MAG TPA: DNA polymerase III subunit gamma/tau [Flavobacteriales bacterium]|jgi:DNA polymerase-3 subunit gamma/tau|nr:DNA polymerase III subunit gamma/tau [Flavobacteriales bacterium]|tara:strand:+ start:3685 stop:5409 length:1725 start_codon:yes stop_codon:yes gene_type:complete
MGEFIVSARKYRPTTFKQVVGQSAITTTLINVISENHLAQSFLFCGPRGVGKTTCARILAKTINCQNINEKVEPCNSCESCTSFNESNSFNIHELDAASNNSVDDIRNLIDQVRFAPQIGNYNIYIIDEVHMLSSAAFNAFLKTLEEPPSHAIFILATTEKHKIIPTILSRCQIFDFKRISTDDIVSHLTFVAESENILAEQDALHIIAQKSDGSLRDSLSIFDRLASFSKGITYKLVIENLNILDHDYYFKITNSILEQDISNALLTFNIILENGFDGHHFINGLASHFRDLLVSKDKETLVLLEKGKALKQQYLEQSNNCEQTFLLRALDICNKCDVQYKTSKNQQLLVELTLMKLCSIGIEELKKKTTNSIKLPTSSPKQEKVVADAITEIKKEEQKVEVLIEKPKQTQTNGVEIEKQDSKISQLISISDLPDPLKDEQRQETIKDKKKNEFNNEELQKVWQEYISIQKEKGKPNFATTLDMNSPVLKEGNQVEILISNKSQEIVIEKEKIDLHEYLRKKLENDAIEVITKIQENNKEKVPYTNKDKYEQMTKENPKLQSLKEKLGLDFDF